MIKGNIDVIDTLVDKEPVLSYVSKFIKENDLNTLSTGSYEIDGKKVYVNIDEYETCPYAERNYEAHEKYVDVQMIIQGKESIYIDDKKDLEIKTEYSDEKDIAFYKDGNNGQNVELAEKEFLVIYPSEAHKPCVMLEEKCRVKKAVFKIKL